MKNIAVIGVGYVGLVTGTCFADLGNRVTSLDVVEKKVENLKNGILPIYEPGLKEIVDRNVKAGRLRFTTNYEEALHDAEFVFICVGTPEGVDGEADLQYVRMAAETIAKTMKHPLIVINKSTVPVGTGDWVANIIKESQPKPIDFSVVSCPEFLRKGSAIRDFFNPDRTVLGSTDKDAANRVAQLHLALRAPIVVTDLRTAEMIKYASNAFLATRISFINEIANICEALGADVKEVAQGMGYDKRIGHHFLEPGVGYGGSCFEGQETVFVIEHGQLVAKSLETLFKEAGVAYTGDTVEVQTPQGTQVLAFDLLTGCPDVADVRALTRRNYNDTMVTINTSMGRQLSVTADHPLILRKKYGFDVVAAAEVKPHDQLMLMTELPMLNKAPRTLNLIELLKGTALEQDVYVSPTDDSFTALYAQYVARIPADMLRYPHEIKRHNRMSLPLYRHLTELGVLKVEPTSLQLYTAKGAATKINAIIDVDAPFMRLCGYYLAEGFISHDTGRAGAIRQRVGFTFHEHEVEYIQDVHTALTQLGLKYIQRHATHAITTLVSSRIFAWLLRDVLGCGTNSADKGLPPMAFQVSAEARFELLRGAFSGDGSVTRLQQGKNLMFEYATVSKPLADGVILLLQTLGVVPSLRQRLMNKSKRVAYIVRVSGYDQLVRLKHVFGAQRLAQIEEGLAQYQRHIRQHGFERQGVVATVEVLKVEHTTKQLLVYSLETSTGTAVVSSGLIVHNCFPKDVKALAHMAQVHGTEPQLLQSVMDINQTQRKMIILKLREALGDLKGKTVAMLGLAFKENTDDIRESPSLDIAQMLHDQGAKVRGYDPVAAENVERQMPFIDLAKDVEALVKGVDALVIATPWNEFKALDMDHVRSLMKQPILIDGRNLYDPHRMKQTGFNYRGVGRGFRGALDPEKSEQNGTRKK